MRISFAIGAMLLVACSGSSLGDRDDGGPGFDSALPPGVDAGPGVDAFVPPGVDAGPDAAPAPLACDERFTAPASAAAGVPFTVAFTDDTGWAHIGLEASGAGAPASSLEDIAGGPPYTWTYRVRGHAAGVLTLVFTADMGATRLGACQIRVSGDAPPGMDAGTPTDAGTPAVDGGPGAPTGNRFGIGFVGPGNTSQLDMAADLAGPGGYVKLIFVGVRPGMSGPTEEWVRVTRQAYERGLIPVVRFAPDWGDRRVRNQSDSGDGLAYTGLAASYVAILRGLPIPTGWPFYVEVHNEPNLCYEWACDRGVFPGDRISGDRIALEYASMLRDVADAIHATGDARYRVVNGGLAPGGVRSCECVGAGEGAFEAGNTSRDFLAAMERGVPGIFSKLDAFASHAYPAEGEGWGFFVPYDRAGPGLRYFETELSTIGRPDLPVLMTETGWPREFHGTGYASADQQATWTVQAYENVWLTHPNILAIMPFILQDGGSWDGFAWVDAVGNPRPVFGAVRDLRCRSIPGRCP